MSSVGRLKAQDPVFSQFYASPLHLNPAFAGTTHAPKVTFTYRNQWSSIFNAYVTYGASFDKYFGKARSGVGITALVDQAGDGIYNTSRFNASYAYQLPLGESFYLKGGVQAGIYQVSLDWDRLVFLDQLDPIEGPIGVTEETRPAQLSKTYFDVSAGFLVYGEIFYAGLATHHINTPDESLLLSNDALVDGLPMRFDLHAGAQISLNRGNNPKMRSFISPNILYSQQRNFRQINAGAQLGLGPIFLGTWYRYAFSNADAAIFSVGVKQGIFKIGYSYDLTVSGLSSESNGSHEIGLILNFDEGRKKRIDYNDCFELFR